MRITLAEDSALLRESLAQLLTAEGHEIIDSVGTAVELLHAVRLRPPDLVVADVRMPPDHIDEGIRAALAIRREQPDIPVLVLSQYVERRHAAEFLTGTGGVGYLLKDRIAAIDSFLDAVDRVGAGGTAFDPEVVRQLLQHSRTGSPIQRLTTREREVLELIAQGLSNAAVSERLYITRSAVEKHINAIFGKLDLPVGEAHNRRVLAILEHLRAQSDG
ncbi:response regulator transcription factor [Nocardia donostiensis]|uniref:DNA-binding response regulator n=1 Tax=Nocardia donostiensis TaxID=1538463 RepID=A0A1W0ATK2_9NOCA|nr:response regulator transcription factor [Nocardia donostiensis]ONM49462.1 DNA-binding response regulator [Nocardia donostiensis]OQS13558.1 DNA-binding response regulator [Nocardia donostiensis]OQS19939.1 DNA-binding response regulator [Nocardia donostiensis]